MSDYSSTYPTQSPTFAFDAKAGKLDSRLSYSRSSGGGTAFSSERHLSSENFLKYSNDLSNADWNKARVTVGSTNNTAPDGSSTASSILETAVTDTHTFYDQYTSVTGVSYTHTVFAKANGRTTFTLYTRDANATFDLSAPSVVNNGMDSVSITAIGSTGWYKCVATQTATNTLGILQVVLLNSGAASYLGDVTKGMYFWGMQASSLGETVLNQTSGSIHRSFAPTLKSYSADTPRFEYDPITGNSEGLLIEAQSSNLLTYSEDFSNAAWTKTNVTAAAEAISPDGTLNAFAIRENDGGGTKRIHQAATVVSGSVAVSVYVKMLGNERRLVIREDSTTGDSAVFDLSSGTVAATNVGGAGTIESVGNGWYRCTLITSPGAGSKAFGFWLATVTGTNYESYTGDGYSGVILFGAMCENASASSSYLESLGSTTTRAADSCSVATSSFYTGGPVTMVGEVSGSGSGYSALFELRDTVSKSAGINDYMMVWKTNAADTDASNFSLYVNSSSTLQAGPTITGSGGATTVATRVDTDNVGVCADGGTVTTDTSAVLPDSLDTLYIGRSYSGYELGSTIKRLAIYNVALSDTELQALTS